MDILSCQLVCPLCRGTTGTLSYCVLLVLTTFQVPLFLMRFGQSNLYRSFSLCVSEDYGKTFKDVTHVINHTFIQTEFGIAISPDHSGKVILTGDVSEFGGFRLFRSRDFGLTFEPTDLPFVPLIQMLYNPGDCNTLLTLSITVAALIKLILNFINYKIRVIHRCIVCFLVKGFSELLLLLLQCKLHIYASYSTAMKMNVPVLPLSQPNAVGLILAHGSVGESESALAPDVYVSDDGGYSWLQVLKGPHHYAILDSGGLLVAVEHTNSPLNQIKFSTDEGQCWHTYNFTSDPFHFSGMDSEPGSRSMNVSLWGYRNDYTKWVVITVDFKKLLTRDCTERDYEEWLAHSADPSGSNDGCVMGYKETFLRMKKDSVCWNGRDFAVTKKQSPCPCSVSDYHWFVPFLSPPQ
ncbi:hypothetical protein XENOCAPTIV_007174 [Xenoophorus captivus]|uniref:VPS10 domain-containing protein n=1 Tax=Xenoophorus captivus TaxID=1517983 RepID=A0ABV0QQG1_9TELE